MASAVSLGFVLTVSLSTLIPQVGTGAYYRQGLLGTVCERRKAMGWYPPGATLDCDFPCLMSDIFSRTSIGEYRKVFLPGCNKVVVCHIVDTGMEVDYEWLKSKNEVGEFQWDLVVDECGWNGYQEDVIVWPVQRPAPTREFHLQHK